jgi:hypothetical protein
MGSELSITKTLGLTCINDLIKYVLNDCESDCRCSECCTCHIETHEVNVASESLDVDFTTSDGGGLKIHT